MKVFISMGMKSKSTEQVRQEMQKVFTKIKDRFPYAELIDSVIENADKEIAVKGDSVGIWYLGKSLQMLAEADIVFFVDNYRDFRGCSIERLVAEKYGKICAEINTAQ